jgi:hypothetical protein
MFICFSRLLTLIIPNMRIRFTVLPVKLQRRLQVITTSEIQAFVLRSQMEVASNRWFATVFHTW